MPACASVQEHVNMAAGGVAFGDLLSITPQALPQDTQANIPAVPLQGPSGLAPPVAVNSAQSIQIRRPSKEQHKKVTVLQTPFTMLIFVYEQDFSAWPADAGSCDSYVIYICRIHAGVSVRQRL